MEALETTVELVQRAWKTWVEIEEAEEANAKERGEEICGLDADKAREKDQIIARLEEGLVSTTSQMMEITKKCNFVDSERSFLEKRVDEYKRREDEYTKRIVDLETALESYRCAQTVGEATLREMYNMRESMQHMLESMHAAKDDILKRCTVLENDLAATQQRLEAIQRENTLLRKLLAVAEVVTEHKYTLKLFTSTGNGKEGHTEENLSEGVNMQSFLETSESISRLRTLCENAQMENESLKAVLAQQRSIGAANARAAVLNSFALENTEMKRCRKGIEKLCLLLTDKNNFAGLCEAASEAIETRKKLDLALKALADSKPEEQTQCSMHYMAELVQMKDEEIKCLRSQLLNKPLMVSKEIETDEPSPPAASTPATTQPPKVPSDLCDQQQVQAPQQKRAPTETSMQQQVSQKKETVEKRVVQTERHIASPANSKTVSDLTFHSGKGSRRRFIYDVDI